MCTINARAHTSQSQYVSCLLKFIYVTKIILLGMSEWVIEWVSERECEWPRVRGALFQLLYVFHSKLIVTCEELQTFSLSFVTIKKKATTTTKTSTSTSTSIENKTGCQVANKWRNMNTHKGTVVNTTIESKWMFYFFLCCSVLFCWCLALSFR